MDKFAQTLANALLLLCASLLASCSNSASGLTTGATSAGDVPAAISNDDPQARPIAVAWTSARAQRCGFYFDATKLRASYLAYEAKQSNPDQLAKAQKSYDSTVKVIGDRVAGDPDYCTDRKGTEIKTDLQRHLAGDFTPKLPQTKKVETCGMFGCAPVKSDEPFDAKKLFDDLNKKQTGL
jgi:hypothetical protein